MHIWTTILYALAFRNSFYKILIVFIDFGELRDFFWCTFLIIFEICSISLPTVFGTISQFYNFSILKRWRKQVHLARTICEVIVIPGLYRAAIKFKLVCNKLYTALKEMGNRLFIYEHKAEIYIFDFWVCVCMFLLFLPFQREQSSTF